MPSFTSTLLLTTLATLSTALFVSEPSKSTVWDSSKTNTIKWDSVSTDPGTFDIYLAHMSVQPPLYSLLFPNVEASKGTVSVSGLQLPTGNAYQINLVAHDKPEQIYAQSAQFNVTGEAVQASSTVEGYTGPTYSPSTKSAGTTLTRVTASGTSTGTAAVTTTGSSSATESSSASNGTSGASNGTSTGSGSGSGSGSGAGSSTTPSSSASPSASKAAAAGGVVVSSGLMGLVFGAFAMLI